MNLQLQLPPEIEIQLTAQSARTGKTPAALALEALEEKFAAESNPPRTGNRDWADRLEDCINLHPQVAHFIDDSRESIYNGGG